MAFKLIGDTTNFREVFVDLLGLRLLLEGCRFSRKLNIAFRCVCCALELAHNRAGCLRFLATTSHKWRFFVCLALESLPSFRRVLLLLYLLSLFGLYVLAVLDDCGGVTAKGDVGLLFVT